MNSDLKISNNKVHIPLDMRGDASTLLQHPTSNSSLNVTTYERDNCVLCDDSKLCDIKTIKMPLYIVNNPENITWDMKYGYCEQCYSIQLKTLLDPNILYDKNYIQPVSTSYSWVQHNMSFINFIIKSIN